MLNTRGVSIKKNSKKIATFTVEETIPLLDADDAFVSELKDPESDDITT